MVQAGIRHLTSQWSGRLRAAHVVAAHRRVREHSASVAISVDILLVLKAYFLGHAIASGETDRAAALKLISTAIRDLEERDDYASKLRSVFYILLNAEILRGTAETIELRGKARSLSEQIKSDIFSLYMAVQDATQSRKIVSGIQTGIITGGSIRTHSEYIGGTRFSAFRIRKNVVFEALGLEERDFSEREVKFLNETSLKQILEKHGLESAP